MLDLNLHCKLKMIIIAAAGFKEVKKNWDM